MKTKFFALFYGTIVSADIVPEKRVVRLMVEVSEVVTNIGDGHKRTWNFPRQRRVISFDVKCSEPELKMSGILKPGSQVHIATKAVNKDYDVTSVECEHQDAVPFNDFLHSMEKLG